MAVIPTVYTPEEVAKFLRVGPDVVIRAAENGEIKAFRIGPAWRITEPALLRIMGDNFDRDGYQDASGAAHVVDGRPAVDEPQVIEDIPAPLARSATPRDSGSPSNSLTTKTTTGIVISSVRHKNTSAGDVRRAKQWVWKVLREVSPDLSPYAPTKEFIANGKQGVLSIATIDNPVRPGDYFFGFPQDLLKTGRPAFLVAVVAPRDSSEPLCFVIPCQTYGSEIEGWSVDKKTGQKKYHVVKKAGSFYLTGVGMQPVAIDQYLNAFRLLQ